MNAIRTLAASLLLSLVCVSIVSGQENKTVDSAAIPAVNPAVAAPYLLVLVHQEIQYGKAAARQKLEVATTRLCNRLDVPNSWIDLQSLSGPRDVLFFDPFDSFEQLEQSFAQWTQIYATHPDLARMREEIDALLKTEDTTIAVRRNDLGYRADHIDLSEARFMRVVEVRLLPGHEGDFIEASRIVGDASDKIGQDIAWVVYQVKFGTDTPVFLAFMPMSTLRQNDDLLTWEEDVRKAEGEAGELRLEQIAREGYVSTKIKLYAISTEMSHVSKGLAASNPESWTPKSARAVKPAVTKRNASANAGQDTAKATALKISQNKQNR